MKSDLSYNVIWHKIPEINTRANKNLFVHVFLVSL